MVAECENIFVHIFLSPEYGHNFSWLCFNRDVECSLQMEIAFVINPYAGMGLKYRMKGSDSIRKDSPPESYALTRAREFLMELDEGIELFTSTGTMGEEAFKYLPSLSFKKIIDPHPPYSADDTVNFARLASGFCDLIIFVGGDGTARDVVNGNTEGKPILGIPSGMKMYSSVFASSPESAARLVNRVYRSDEIKTAIAEVIDLDEALFQKGEMQMRKYADVVIPVGDEIVSDPKNVYASQDTELIADYVIDTMDDSYYIIGTGTTCKMILEKLGYETNPLAVYVLKGKKLIAEDIYAEDFIRVYNGGKVKLVISPTGGQGFLFGRGNRQLTIDLLKLVNKEDIIVLSSTQKINDLEVLRVDLPGFSEYYNSGYIRVLVGYSDYKIVKLLVE